MNTIKAEVFSVPHSIKLALATLIALGIVLFSNTAYSASAQELNIKADATIERFKEEVSGGEKFLQKAHGVLVFPSVIKAGIGIGGEFGEGVMRIGGETVEYYNTAGVSIGFQLGAQTKSILMVFLETDALEKFRSSKGWEAGVDGSVAVVKWGAGEDINSTHINQPIAGFVFSNKGLMYNLTLEGSKFTKIKK